MKVRVLHGVLVVLAVSSHPSAMGQMVSSGYGAADGSGQVGVIRGHAYRNTEWKRIRNTFLNAFDRDALRSVWPYRGYDVQDVRLMSCTSPSQSWNESVGRTLAFVRDESSANVELRRYEGVELDFRRLQGSEPQVRDLCQWIGESDGMWSGTVGKAVRYFDSLNPPADGTWVLDRSVSDSLLTEFLPWMQAVVHFGREEVESVLQSEFHSIWSNTDKTKALKWRLMEGDLQESVEAVPQAVWKYESEDEAQEWDYLLTSTTIVLMQSDSELWRSTSTGFVWNSVPELSAVREQTFILWYNPNRPFSLGRKWYVVTDVGLPRLRPLIRIDKDLARETVGAVALGASEASASFVLE